MAAAAWLLPIALALAVPDSPRGGLVEKIVCADSPEHSYALFLPSSYTAARPAPALYLFDARGRALLPMERFREAAEEFGWILISSYDTRSDTSGDPNTPAVNAMWSDTHARLAIDGRRTYVGGFSGGGRLAVGMALRAPERIAGAIGCGAGFPDEGSGVTALPFAYFGTIGDRDFNYSEMRALEARLSAAKAPHRIAVFAGEHEWPPPELARDALAWMELQAARKGTRTGQTPTVTALYRLDLDGGNALQSQGKLSEAFLRFTAVARDFDGLADTSEAVGKAAALERDASVQKALRDARQRDARDAETLQSLQAKLRSAAGAAELAPARKVAFDLGIPALRKTALSDSPEERLSAQRILANLRVQTAFYLPRQSLERQDYPRAVFLLEIAAEIDPDEPEIYYRMAAAHARAGDSSRALRDLQRAVDRGFRRFEALETDPDFARLRDRPAFQKWLAKARI